MENETIQAEGTTEEKPQVPTATEVLLHNTVIRYETELRNGTTFESFGQALQMRWLLTLQQILQKRICTRFWSFIWSEYQFN